MNLLCWMWGHQFKQGSLKPATIQVREQLNGPWQDIIDLPLMTPAQLEIAVELVRNKPFLACRIRRYGTEFCCGRCHEMVEAVEEADSPKNVVDCLGELRFVDGWLRKLAMPLGCMLRGHETEWHRDIARRADREVCVHCLAEFRVISDRDRRLRCQPR